MKTQRSVGRSANPAEWRRLERLVDRQLAVLAGKRCPKKWLKLLGASSSVALSVAARNYQPGFDLSLMAVVPACCVGLKRLLSWICLDGKRGFTSLDTSKLVDVIATPALPYWVFSVICGQEETVNLGSDTASTRLQQKLRRPMTISEAVALCVHDEHGIAITKIAFRAGASRHDLWSQVPLIFWDYDDNAPCLGSIPTYGVAPNFALPSLDEELMIEGFHGERVRAWKSRFVKQ